MIRLCTICARGGSKGLPGKNTKLLVGKPLIAYSIKQARESGLFQYLAVSSDSEEILEIAKANGVDILVKRPDELATDTAAKLPVIRHCVSEVEHIAARKFDTIVDLDATSPLRLPIDIVNAVQMLESSGASNLITGMPARRSPYFNLVEIDENQIVHLSKPLKKQIVRRQDAPLTYDMNASIYVWQRNALYNSETLFNNDTRLYEMPEWRSIDIDSELDFMLVELILKKRILNCM